MKRRGEPIDLVPLRDAVNPHITYSMHFLEWEAFIEAGSTLRELLNMDTLFTKEERAKIVAWYKYHNLIKLHADDAVRTAERGRSKKGR